MENKLDFSIDCWYERGCGKQFPGCKKTCHRYLEMNCLITNCGMKNAAKFLKTLVPPKIDVPKFKKLMEIKENIVPFVEEGRNLYIGAVNLQTGKTTWSLKILYKYFDEIWVGNGFRVRGYFLHVPELLNKLKDYTYKDTLEYKIIDKYLNTCDIVVWDDITSMQLTTYEQSILNMYIDKRQMEDKSNIFNGTYYEDEEMEKMIGSKLTARLNNAQRVILQGKSWK